ncbi:MAG: hypothetical protein ACP5NN_05810 [Methanolinea sp.]
MKAILYAGILVLTAVIIGGCMTTQPPGEPVPPAPKYPSLLGNWSGTMMGYVEGQGFTEYKGSVMTMSVTEQKDRIFKGDFIFTDPTGLKDSEKFAGVINRDERSFTIVEGGGGYTFGSLITPDEMELIYVDDAEPIDVAIDTLTRS